MQISVGNLKIQVHSIININKDAFVLKYENDYLGDINDAWDKVKSFTIPYKTIIVKDKKGV
jgi:hypothetical protein